MTRKRNNFDRGNDQRRRRPKHPAPREGLLLVDVARLTAVPVRTLRDYVQRGLLRYSERRGTITRYPCGEVVRLLAALCMKTRTNTWAEIKLRIDGLSAPDLERWLLDQGLVPAVAVELGIALPARLVARPPDGTRDTHSTERADAGWQRIELLPGLEVRLSASASPAVKRLAQRIIDEHSPADWSGGTSRLALPGGPGV